MNLTAEIARRMCCNGGACRYPDNCHCDDPTQLISIPQAAEIAAKSCGPLICDVWRQQQRETMATQHEVIQR